MKIMLVDDSVATLDAMKALLESTKSTVMVFQAANATSALTQFAQRPEINLIITDFYLPDTNGTDFCAKVRKTGSMVPVVITTAASRDTLETIRKDCAALGNIIVLQKPVEPATIIRLVEALKASSTKQLNDLKGVF